MLSSAYIFFSRRFSSSRAFIWLIIDASMPPYLAALMHSTGRFGDERQAFAGCATPQASFASRRS